MLICWQLFAMILGQRTMVFPGPAESFRYAFELLKKPYTYRCISATMSRMLEGFLIALFWGLVFGIIAGNKTWIGDFLSPFITTLRAVPTASLVYLFIVLAGFKKAPVCLVVLICFPILYEGVKSGIENIPKNLIHATEVDGASFFRSNFRIYLPLAELVDVEKELERIAKELKKAEGQSAGMAAKLSNEAFLAKAPANVVEAEREKARKLEALVENLRESKAKLEALR